MSGVGVRVAGLDGCRGGWVLATAHVRRRRRPPRLEELEITVVPRFADALAHVLAGSIAAMGVDMPIGLPDAGQRPADRAARLRLGPRRSSVFPTPVRAALHASDYADALERSRAVDGRGLSKQAFNLLPRMVEVDEAMTPDLQRRVFECHPETVFARLNREPLASTKRTTDGFDVRWALLDPWLAAGRDAVATAPTGARRDDVLDALALAITAWRFIVDDVEHLGDGERDARGLRMEIVV